MADKRTCRFIPGGIEISNLDDTRTTFPLPDGCELVGFDQKAAVDTYDVPIDVPENATPTNGPHPGHQLQQFHRGEYVVVLHLRDPSLAHQVPGKASAVDRPRLAISYTAGAPPPLAATETYEAALKALPTKPAAA